MSNATQCWEDVTKIKYDKYKENIEPLVILLYYNISYLSSLVYLFYIF